MEKSSRSLERRTFLKVVGVGGSVAVPGLAATRAGAAPALQASPADPSPDLMNTVSTYLVASPRMRLAPEVVTKAKHHILDTLVATISGAGFKVGRLSRDFAKAQGGAPEASVAGESFLTNAINAALANGNMAHADETDDSHEPSGTHPGCAIIPAALAVAEKEDISGLAFLNAVVVGYDIGCRINQAMNRAELTDRNIATHAIGGCFGAVAACASAMRLDNLQTRYAFDYAAQQASGTRLYVRDLEHVQKAFVFGGLPARSGTMAAAMARSGFTGVSDIFSGESNWFRTFTSNPSPELLVHQLGVHHSVMATNIKKYSVGSPMQAPVEALTVLIDRHRLKATDVKAIEVRVPSFAVVNDRLMPDINLQYCLAATMLDGGLSFKAAHDFARMRAPEIQEMRARMTILNDPSLRLPETSRTALVTVTRTDGSTVSQHIKAVPGTAQNPMNTAQVEAKARDILVPDIGAARTERLIETVGRLETLKSVRELRPLLMGA
jgi:2-methylcitrate dehydratase PrpD